MGGRALTVALAAVFAASAALCPTGALAQDTSARPIDTHALFRAVGALYGLDPQLLESIARVESGDDADAVSPKGAQGLMQLMPETARRFRVTNSFDPVENALGAARFLDYLRRSMATRDLPLRLPELLAAYNAGEAAVTEYHGIPPYPETQQYVRRVLINYLLDGAAPSVSARLARLPARSSAAPVQNELLDPLQEMAEIRRQRAAALPQPPTRSAVKTAR